MPGCAANGGIPQLVYRSQNFNVNNTGSFSWKANAAYVTGTHSVKVGYQGTYMVDNRVWSTNNNELEYRVANGVPKTRTVIEGHLRDVVIRLMETAAPAGTRSSPRSNGPPGG